MNLLIDPRTGSNKLFDQFPGEHQSQMLEAGDVAFFGNGPTGDWFIGIEYKTMNDVVDCIKSGRFIGTQLPGMLNLYDACFLLVEGIPRPDRRTGQLVRYCGKSNSYPMGLTYRQYDNFLTSMTVFTSMYGKPCIVKPTGSLLETVTVIRNIYELFQKEWSEHTSMRKPDLSKVGTVTFDLSQLKEPMPGDPEYPQYVCRRTLFSIRGVGWALAGSMADKYGTVENLLMASHASFAEFDHVGKTLAQRIYNTLHGHSDPEYPPKKKRKEDA